MADVGDGGPTRPTGCEVGHPARRGAAWAMVFMLAEAGVGAALVLFRLVADNASMTRAMFMSAHLANTFLLLAFAFLADRVPAGGTLDARAALDRVAARLVACGCR